MADGPGRDASSANVSCSFVVVLNHVAFVGKLNPCAIKTNLGIIYDKLTNL